MTVIAAWILAYFATGAFVGFLAGLLGIGGGMTLVPVLAAMFAAQQFAPGHTVHLALGTGMASIMFTSSASVRTHHRLGGVDWSLVRRMGPAMVDRHAGRDRALGLGVATRARADLRRDRLRRRDADPARPQAIRWPHAAGHAGAGRDRSR